MPRRTELTEADRARSLQIVREQMRAGTSLSGGLAFMTTCGRAWTPPELYGWFDEQIVAPGWMRPPRALREPGAPTIDMNPRSATANHVAILTAKARRRVALVLLDFVMPNPEGQFLRSTLYSARVQRVILAGQPGWRPAPRETDFLSEIVLSLFAAEILSHSERYRAHLTICRDCAQLEFTQDGQAGAADCPHCGKEAGAAR